MITIYDDDGDDDDGDDNDDDDDDERVEGKEYAANNLPRGR